MGLTVSVPKAKGMASGDGLSVADTAPLQADGGEIEIVKNFTYLGSVVSNDGDISEDIKRRLAKASHVFGCLRLSIFANSNVSLGTKRAVYQATVLAVLLYGAETWTLKAPHVRCLTVFHNHCIRTILGVSRYKQWQQHLTSAALRDKFGIEQISKIIMERRLRGWAMLGVWMRIGYLRLFCMVR